MEPPAWLKRWGGLALILLALPFWLPALHGGIETIDSPWLVADNPLLNRGDPASIPTIFLDLSPGARLTLGAEYLPVRDLSVLLDFALFGDSWLGHHATNLALYLASCALWLAVCRRLLGSEPRAWLAAGLFALHPVHVESVAWLASRKDVLSLLFFLLSLLAWLRGRLLACTLAFALAYWSKNTAITLPALLALISALHQRQDPRDPRWWLRWLPLAAVAAAGLALTLRLGEAVAMMAPARADSAWGVLLIEAQVIARYAEMLLWPGRLSLFYAEPAPDLLPAVPGLALIGLLLLLAALCVRRRPAVTLGILWFFLTLLPVSQVVPIQNLMADRYLLLPSAGAALAVAAALPPLPARWRAPGLALAAAALLALGLATAKRAALWRDPLALWADVTEKQPALAIGWTSYAGLLIDAGELPQAREALAEARSNLPDHPQILQSEGLLALAAGDAAAAEAALRAALSADPELRKAANNLMILLKQRGELAEAAALGERTLAVHPLYAEGWNTLGSIYLDQRRLPEAAAALERALALAPYGVSTLLNLGNAAYLQQDYASAARWWRQALELDPGNDYAREGLEHLAKITAPGASSTPP